MRLKCCALGTSLVILAASPSVLLGQDRWPVSVEANLGATFGRSDNDQRYRGGRNGILFDLLVGARLHPPNQSGAFIALDAGVHAPNIVVTDDCPMAPDGGCIPWFPGFGLFSLLGGWESRATNVRLLAGPGLLTSDSFEKIFGVVSRFDVALPVIGHVSASATINTLFVPSFDDDRFFFLGLGAGVRLR